MARFVAIDGPHRARKPENNEDGALQRQDFAPMRNTLSAEPGLAGSAR